MTDREPVGDRAAPRCSFCGKERREVERLMAGVPSAWVCDECLVLCNDIIEESGEDASSSQPTPAWEPSEDELEELDRIGREVGNADLPRTRTPSLTCSFCGRSEADVRKLIAGPSVYICDECVGRLSSERG